MPGPSAVIVHSFIKPTSELITSSLSIAVKGLFKSTFCKKKKKSSHVEIFTNSGD